MSTIRNAKSKADIISAMNDENLENTIQRKFNKLPEVFECVVLSNWEGEGIDTHKTRAKTGADNSTKFYLVRIRSFGDSDIFRPSPYDAGLSKQQIYERINAHRQAIVDNSVATETPPTRYTVWEGRYSGKNYLPPIILTKYKRKDTRIIKVQKKEKTVDAEDTVGSYKLQPDTKTYGIEENNLIRVKATWENWIKISRCLKPLFEIIKKTESSNATDPYNNYNMWPLSTTKNLKWHNEKYITTHRWHDCLAYLQAPFEKSTGQGLEVGELIFAAGAYQIVPDTMLRLKRTNLMKEIITGQYINKKGETKTGQKPVWMTLMNKESQDAAAAYLLMGDEDPGHPKTTRIIASYLMGKDASDKNKTTCAHVIAKIWAGIPCQKDDTNRKGIDVVKGQTYYEGYGNNKADKSQVGPMLAAVEKCRDSLRILIKNAYKHSPGVPLFEEI